MISAAAGELFYERGFDRVSMSDIAGSVDIRASAIYRHFTNKQQLLQAILVGGLEPMEATVGSLDLRFPSAAAASLARFALDNRSLGILLQRELRHLGPDDQATIRSRLRALEHRLGEQFRAARPGLSVTDGSLLAWSTLSVLASISFHRVACPRPAYDRLLADLVKQVIETDLPSSPAQAPATETQGGPLIPRSRREALLEQAVALFARKGYANVGIEDVGAAVGIAGASVYNHFPTKSDILVTALDRGSAVLFADLAYILRSAGSAAEALSQLVRSYVTFSERNPHTVDVMVTQLEHLPEDEQGRLRKLENEYISEWVHLIRAGRPGLDADSARVRVHAVLTVANNGLRTPRLRRVPAVSPALEAICIRLLADQEPNAAPRADASASDPADVAPALGATGEALGDELVDLVVVEAGRVNPDREEEAVELQADDAVHARPGGQAQHEVTCGRSRARILASAPFLKLALQDRVADRGRRRWAEVG
jgi:AcrR family transcriptional regulator